jgi:hypothetical protein
VRPEQRREYNERDEAAARREGGSVSAAQVRGRPTRAALERTGECSAESSQ